VDVHNVIIRDDAGDLTAHYMIAVHAGLWRDGTPVAADDIVDARFVRVTDIAKMEMTPRARELIAAARQRFAADITS
ncbi:MAG: hypothetical protein AAFR55_09455, partial [Pseudomonadota bacterium]